MGALVAALAGALALSLLAPSAAAAGEPVPSTTYGDVTFPRDEHQRLDAGNYWWGALNVATRGGNQYTLGIGWVSLYGVLATGGHQLIPHQGPYHGQAIMSMDGPASWGHESQGPIGELSPRYENRISTYHPRRSPLVQLRTYDTDDGGKQISSYQRVSAESETYRLRLDHGSARLHPDGRNLQLRTDITATMKSPPLLLGGTGTWWYTMPETIGYPSRSFQYMQAAQRVTGWLELEQPDGSILRERVDPGASQMVFVRELDATPEDFFVGLAASVATQLHPRMPLYFQGYVPWDIIFVDLDNGAQLMLAMLAFHESQNGILTPLIAPGMPTYTVAATLRLPSGESVPLDETIRVEHLDYHERGAGPTPFLFVDVLHGIWTQSWRHRVSHPRMTVEAPGGERVTIPKIDIGLLPQFEQGEPAVDEEGLGLKGRVPFTVAGSWGGCPVRGFGWSEMINNWYGYEAQDPWFTGRRAPAVPERCGPEGRQPEPGSPGNLSPPPDRSPLRLGPEDWQGCSASNPGETSCEFVATAPGGVFGIGEETGAWRVEIDRPGREQPLIVRHLSTNRLPYRCGTIREGDRVTVIAEQPGATVYAGNPGICL